jgi:metal-dependent amidase/aminoacylase/carboxypeptidase family protein
VALQQVVARRVDPVHPTVLSIGTLQAGTAANVIPEEAVATGTLRCLHEADRDRLRELIRTCVEATARAFGCEAAATFVTGEPALVNDPALVAATAHELPDRLRRHDAELRSCGADDVAELARLGPALMGFVGLAGHPAFTPAALHSPTFLPPDDAVPAVTSGYLAAYAGATRMHAAS